MKRKLTLFAVLLITASIFVIPSFAQDDAFVIRAQDLTNPRHIFFDADDNLYVVEAGHGGTILVPGFSGNSGVGMNGQVSFIPPRSRPQLLIPGLHSVQSGARGPMGIQVTEDTIWLALGEADTPRLPFTSAVVALDIETYRVKHYIDLYTPEAELNPDGAIVASNPVDLVLGDDGTLYIADASANTVWQWTETNGVSVFATWDRTDNPVPTAVDISPDGEITVGFLSGFPFPTEASRIEKWSTEGELIETIDGMTMVVDIHFASDGTLYAVEYSSGTTSVPANSGRVVVVGEDGLTPIAEGLHFPYGMGEDSDGNLYVAINSRAAEGEGQVLQITGNE